MEQNQKPDPSQPRRVRMGWKSVGRPVQAHVPVSGKRLREIRVERNVSGWDLARALGIAPGTYYAYESERSRPSRRSLAIICDILRCQPEDVIK